ncbi:uncharacterized protein [Spinacia oleracea]|uniref:Ubiquitin-like protease family profile domain-containing protein n=1 Tax=Spinacia oleracea TaxID=3562 RepID=A0ABM3QXA1_SPIOL|nr:uncharacterized protein LOC110799896 [Spinacia oleracea]
MKERSRKYAKSRRLANDVEDEGNDDEEDDEEDGEADVRRVGKKHPKHVGQNVRRYPEDEQHGLRKKHLKVIRKRRRGDTDDEEEQGKPVKKKLLLKKKVGKIVDKERRKGKSPLKDKGMTKRGKNRRVFLRVPIPQHPMSRGEYAKCHDVVVATQRANCDRKQPSVICRTDAFSKIIAGFDDSRRACVQKMGFGGLLELKISKLPRQLCYWLMTRLDGVNSYLVGGDGHVLPITPGHWEDVFGLRNSGLPVPEKDSDLPAGKALAYAVKYGEKNPANNKTTVLISNATRVLLGPLDKLGNLVPLANQRQRTEFMENFMIVLMGQILCPSTDGANMSTKLLGAVCVAKDADQYNWCEFCHKWLLDYAITCQRKLEVQGYAAGTGGCVLFLLVFYLDRLCRLPVRWDEFPRLKVWTEEEVEKVKLHDRKPTEDYGRLSTVDVVYREPHPLFGERRPLAEEVANLDCLIPQSIIVKSFKADERLMSVMVVKKFGTPDCVMERMAPLLQDLRAVIREQVIIRRLGAKESVAEKDPSPGVAEKDPSPASSSHRQISDNAYIDVDGEPMAVDKSVNKVLSELDVIVLEEDETDNVQHTVEQPLGGEENVFVNYQSLPVEQPVFEFLHVPVVVAVQNEPMEEAEQVQQGPPQQVVELVQNEPMEAEQLQKGPPQQAPPQQVVELVQHLEAMQNEPMEALPQHEPQQEPRHEPVQQGHTEGDQGGPQEEGPVVPVVQQEADPHGPIEEPPQNDFVEPQNHVLEDPENEDEEDGEEGDEEDGEEDDEEDGEEGDEDEEDVGNTADQDKPGDDDDENQGANGGTTGEAEGADNAEGPGADGTENTRGGGEGLDHGAVHGSNPEDFDGAEPGGDGQVRTRIKAARPKPSPKPRTPTKRSRKPSEKAIAMRTTRQRLGIRMTKADSSILKYVEAYDTKKKAGGAMLIECDGNDANQQMCYSVVHPRSYVNSQYVRTIAYLYNREWASEFPKSCRRLMLDSMFAHQKLKTKETYAGLLKKWSQPLRKVVSSDISVVFVPVVENEHWWCVAFALKDQKIWFIDSMYKNPAAEHSAELKKLIPAVDYVLLETDKEFNASPTWQTKQMGKWPLDVVGFPDYNDNHACRVVMLMAIRETANAFKKSMHVGEIGAARKALFLSHLNSDYNSCRPLIPEIIATHCR